jgi:predicted RNase H-like HicB family nuclease
MKRHKNLWASICSFRWLWFGFPAATHVDAVQIGLGKSLWCLDRPEFRCYFPGMKYAVLIEPVEESEGMPGFYYAHVPSLGITTHGGGIEGAMAAARDLISLWVEEMRATGKDPKTPGESILATLEVA